MTFWIFQSSPERFDIIKNKRNAGALTDPKYTWDNWRVTRYKDTIKKGDFVFIWVAGKEAGIYAVGDIFNNPYSTDEYNQIADNYFRKNKEGNKEKIASKNREILKVGINYIPNLNLLNHPIYKSEIKITPGLEGLQILKMPRAANFKVTKEEAKIILNLIKERGE